MNNVCLIGRWTKEVDLRYTQDGKPVAMGRIAVKRPYNVPEGQPDTDFFNVIMFGKMAEAVAQYTGKGHLISVEGRLRSRTYEDKKRQKRSIVEVVANRIDFLQPKNGKAADEDVQSVLGGYPVDPDSAAGPFDDFGTFGGDDDPPF